jgi:hypothetical protein
MVSLQEICNHKPPFIACHRRKGRAAARRSISRGINCWIRYALQKFVDAYSSLIPFDTRNIQIQVIDFWHAACSMHDHVSLKTDLLPTVGCSND